MQGVAFVDAVARDPDDSLRAADDGDAIAVSGGNFGIDEDVLELLLAAEAEGAEAVAGAAGADGELGSGSFDVEEGLVRSRVGQLGGCGDDLRF